MNRVRRLNTSAIAFAALGIGLGASTLRAQQVPWLVWADDVSASVCDGVNAHNVELVVLDDTGELVIITGTDTVLADTFVDLDGSVFYLGDPAGFIEFADDGDGFRTLWWLSIVGTVIHVDTLTGEPFDSGFFPDEFVDVPCDACNFWDNPFDCGGVLVDSDLDGIEDQLDFCPTTPLASAVDELGCACFEADYDGDGVDECDDLCPDTPFGADGADSSGCSCFDFDDDLDGIVDCDDLCPATPLGEVVDIDGCACFEIDADADDIVDCDDECPGTPLDEIADDFGCSCSQLVDCDCLDDGDLDGVSDCDDECPNTPLDADVDFTGCSDVVIEPPPIFISCGSFEALSLATMLIGLSATRLVRRRGSAGRFAFAGA
ncbi:MAG: hypothetical protein AABZ12_14750 [Planctomycetota bacterium]